MGLTMRSAGCSISHVSDSNSTKREHADHEAGHFVIAAVTGMEPQPRLITIKEIHTEEGHLAGGMILADMPNASVAQKLVYLLAGREAERYGIFSREGASAATARDADLETSGYKDDEMAHALAGSLSLEAFKSHAGRLVAEHWATIQAVSDDLLEHETLYFDEANWVFCAATQVDPKWRIELEDYRKHRRERTLDELGGDDPGIKIFESVRTYQARIKGE